MWLEEGGQDFGAKKSEPLEQQAEVVADGGERAGRRARTRRRLLALAEIYDGGSRTAAALIPRVLRTVRRQHQWHRLGLHLRSFATTTKPKPSLNHNLNHVPAPQVQLADIARINFGSDTQGH